MSSYPRMVQTDTSVVWDGHLSLVKARTIVDIPPGSELETAYGGPENLEPVKET